MRLNEKRERVSKRSQPFYKVCAICKKWDFVTLITTKFTDIDAFCRSFTVCYECHAHGMNYCLGVLETRGRELDEEIRKRLHSQGHKQA